MKKGTLLVGPWFNDSGKGRGSYCGIDLKQEHGWRSVEPRIGKSGESCGSEKDGM